MSKRKETAAMNPTGKIIIIIIIYNNIYNIIIITIYNI